MSNCKVYMQCNLYVLMWCPSRASTSELHRLRKQRRTRCFFVASSTGTVREVSAIHHARFSSHDTMCWNSAPAPLPLSVHDDDATSRSSRSAACRRPPVSDISRRACSCRTPPSSSSPRWCTSSSRRAFSPFVRTHWSWSFPSRRGFERSFVRC
jgi:hypothetical protein